MQAPGEEWRLIRLCQEGPASAALGRPPPGPALSHKGSCRATRACLVRHPVSPSQTLRTSHLLRLFVLVSF